MWSILFTFTVFDPTQFSSPWLFFFYLIQNINYIHIIIIFLTLRGDMLKQLWRHAQYNLHQNTYSIFVHLPLIMYLFSPPRFQQHHVGMLKSL